MRKLRFLAVAICIIGLMTALQAAEAGLVRLSSAELAGVTGQAGISFLGGFLGLNMENGLVFYTDNDGVDGASSGTLSLSDTFLDSNITAESGIQFETALSNTSFDGLLGSTTMTLENPSININSFHSNVMLGSAPGMGSSIGVIGLRNMQIKTTGSVRVRVN